MMLFILLSFMLIASVIYTAITSSETMSSYDLGLSTGFMFGQYLKLLSMLALVVLAINSFVKRRRIDTLE